MPPSISRRRLLGIAGGTASSLAGCAVLEQKASFPAGDWPQVARDAANTAHYPGENVPSSVTVDWEIDIGNWPHTSPIVGDGRAFVASERALMGIAVVSGEREMHVALPSSPGGTPAYDSAISTVYVPTYDRTTSRDGAFVHAFDVTSGAEKWSQNVSTGALYALTIFDGMVYVRTSDAILALADGEEVWRYDGLGSLAYPEYNLTDTVDLTGNTAPAVTNDAVFVPTKNGLLAVSRATGEKQWQKPVNHALGVSIDRHGVYAQGYTQLRAFARDGTARWTRNDIGGLSSPTLTGDAVYVKNSSRLHELDPKTGANNWSFNLRTGVMSSPSPILDNAVIAPSHRAVAIRRGNGLQTKLSGRKLWETEFDPAAFAAPAVGASHLFLVDPFRRRLIALEGD